jgi:hypothetical protein
LDPWAPAVLLLLTPVPADLPDNSGSTTAAMMVLRSANSSAAPANLQQHNRQHQNTINLMQTYTEQTLWAVPEHFRCLRGWM